MALFPYQRLAFLFEAICQNHMPQAVLAEQLNVSTRTIRTDIHCLNEILTDYGAEIVHQRGVGYQLQILDAARFATLPIQSEKTEKMLPRNNQERVYALLMLFLTTVQPIKIDDIADEWFMSRGAIKHDLNEVRRYFEKYQLQLDTKPHHGSKLVGAESAIRTCLTDIFWQMHSAENDPIVALKKQVLNNIDLAYIGKILQNSIERFDLKLTTEGFQYLIYSCAVSIIRITMGQELLEFSAEKSDPVIWQATAEIAKGFNYFLGYEMSPAECTYLSVQILTRSVMDKKRILSESDQSAQLIEHILHYINQTYHYDLREDSKLSADLLTHITAMMARVKYQISSPNPLLAEIKQFYPFAYDITLTAITNSRYYDQHPLSEDEIAYIAVHIGVALERNYNVSYKRQPRALFVTDSNNSTQRMLEAKIKREFPHLQIVQIMSLREYEQLKSVQEDFVITTVRLSEKNKPIVKLAPFPTPYQIEQLGRLAMIDRNQPYILEHFFDEQFFMVINQPMTQSALFKLVCDKLMKAKYVTADFHSSLVERESIVSTLLGEGIALPHSLGLLAKKTVVVTIIAPQGIVWGKSQDEIANAIFLLAICKDEYEEAMSIYDLFVTFVKEKSTERLMKSKNFRDFQAIAKDSLTRSV